MIILQERFNPIYYLGHRMRIFLKAGAIFNIVVVERIHNTINCIDDDGIELTIDLDDVDFFVDLGVNNEN